MSGPRYAVGEPVQSSGRLPKRLRLNGLAWKGDLRYAHGKKKTACGRLTTGTWALHATKGWKKRA